ncbi:phosphatase PAP2 family protein [Algiphilus aromaticivorans]|uniref:phosphatase PAP2 family protein n=1 Tax=Algiphilus aromaticivorans TaxID=382454 RepID=UPI000694E3D9|nr:phosphatase PAP2 family protein [Algiphilus aromaticivorans]
MHFWTLLLGLIGVLLGARWAVVALWRRRHCMWVRLCAGVASLRLDVPAGAIETRWPRIGGWLRARFDTRHFSGLPLTALALLSLHLLGLGGELIDELREDSELQRLDERIHGSLGWLREARFVALFAWLTVFGDPQSLTVAGLVAGAFLLALRRQGLLVGLLLSVAGSQIATLLGKYVIDRPRPEVVTFVEAATPSFPSGHTTGAMAVYGFVAYALARTAANPRLRLEVVLMAAMLVVLVAMSRLIIGVHYLSDIAAGLVNGAFWVVAGIAVAEWWQGYRTVEAR